MIIVNSQKFQRLMEIAIRKAIGSDMAQKHGAILISKDGKTVLSSGYNTLMRNCIRGNSSRAGLHAEVNSIISFPYRKQQHKRGLWATASYKNRPRVTKYCERGSIGNNGRKKEGKAGKRGQEVQKLWRKVSYLSC